MKSIGYILLILLSIFFFSCQTDYTKNKILLHADSVMSIHPDSALRLLQSIPYPEKLSEADYAAWCLQYSFTQYKLNQDITSDSIIRVAVKYYKNSSLSKQSGTAYYLLGRILLNNKKNKEAMSVYKTAEYILKSTEQNDLKGLVDFEIGYLYKYDETFSESLIYLKKSLYYFSSQKILNTRRMPTAKFPIYIIS